MQGHSLPSCTVSLAPSPLIFFMVFYLLGGSHTQYYWLIAQGLLLAVLRVSKWWWGSSPGVLCAKHVLSHVSFLVCLFLGHCQWCSGLNPGSVLSNHSFGMPVVEPEAAALSSYSNPWAPRQGVQTVRSLQPSLVWGYWAYSVGVLPPFLSPSRTGSNHHLCQD